MRKLVLAAAMLPLGAQAFAGDLPCRLTDEDAQSLAKVSKPLDESAIDALGDDDKKNLCLARALAHRAPRSDSDAEADALAAQLTINDIPVRMSRFVTPEEYAKLRKPVAKVIARTMAQKGMGR